MLSSTLVTSQVLRAPIVAPDGTTYVVGNTGIVHAINPDGSTKWTYTLRSSSPAEMSLGRTGVLYVSDSLGYTYALQSDGALVWEQRYATAAGRSAVVVGNDDTLYLGLPGGQLLTMSASSGATIRTASISSTAVYTPVLAEDGTIYAVTAGGTVVAFGPTGNVIWSTVVGNTISVPPTLARDSTLYVGTTRGHVMTFVDNSGGVAAAPWPMQRHDSAGSSSQCFNSVSFSYVNDTDGDQIEDCDELWLGQDPNDPSDGGGFDGAGLTARATEEKPALLARRLHWLTRSPNQLWHLMLRWPVVAAGRQS